MLKFKKKKESSLTKVAFASGMVKGSIEKLQRPLNVIRGLKLQSAMEYLIFSNYLSSTPIAKLLKSAAANATVKGQVDNLSSLYVMSIWAVKSLELRRMKAGPRGRGRPIRRRFSRVFVELGIDMKENEYKLASTKESKELEKVKEGEEV